SVTVSSNSTSASDSCDWFVTFTGTPGNQDQMAIVIGTEGPAASVTSGDDLVTIETLVNGTVDAIKLELELLPAVGEV
ncbi:unnamed protein product, partial [Scytosiphon promiscuus]